MVTNFARSRWPSAIDGSGRISNSERTGAKVLPCQKRSGKSASERKRREMRQDSIYSRSCFA